MKTATHPATSRRETRKSREFTEQDYGQSLRSCETAAQRIKSASDELTAAWTALCGELSSGISATDLLRKRAWCNVLELRLKERAHELEEARQIVDRLWDDMLVSRRARELFHRYLKKEEPEPAETGSNFTMLARTAIAIAAENRIQQTKK